MIVCSCNDDKGKNIPSLDDFDVETEIFDIHQRLEDEGNLFEVFRVHPSLSEIYFGHILGLPLNDTSGLRQGFKAFMGEEATGNISRLIDSVYSDLSEIEADWKKAIAYYHHYFPNRTIPDLYLMQTNLSIANFLFVDEAGHDAIGTSLDFFLGSAYPYTLLAQENPVFSAYNNRTFNSDHIVAKSIAALAEDMIGQPEEIHFLNMMLREGKKLYMLKQIGPHIPDTVLFEYSPQQLQWCQDNEYEIWNFLIDQELLYQNSLREIAKFLNPAPTSQGMPAEAPGRAAAFVGYRIVEAYMDHNADADLYELIQETDYDHLIEAARYRPRKR